MNDFINIVNTPVISKEYDIFWAGSPEEAAGFSPKPVLVLSLPFQAGSPEEDQLFKMLQACKLTAGCYNIIQISEEKQFSFSAIKEKLQFNTLILLGISPVQLGVSAQLMPHQVSRFHQCNWLVTSSLSELLKSPEIKTHLWNYGLKPVFVDKVYL